MVESDVHVSGNISSANFYYDYLASNVPVVLRGETAAAIRNVEWDDAFFLDRRVAISGRGCSGRGAY